MKKFIGFKQAPHQWYKKLESFMKFETTCDHCVFEKYFSHDDFVILLLYVDDIHIVGHES